MTTQEIFYLSPLTERWITERCKPCQVDNLISGNIARSPSPEKIIEEVCQHLNIPVETIFKRTRKREIVFARQLSMYCLRKKTKLTFKAIGEQFKGEARGKVKDHTTVIHSIQTIKDLMDTDPVVRQQVEHIDSMIAPGHT